MGIGKWGRLALFMAIALAFLASGVSGEEQGATPVATEETATVVKEQPEQTEKLPTLEVVASPVPTPTASVITKDEVALGPDQNRMIVTGVAVSQLAGLDLQHAVKQGDEQGPAGVGQQALVGLI